MSVKGYVYSAYGLHIHTPVECPELMPYVHTEGIAEPPQVIISEQSVPTKVADLVSASAFFSARPGEVVLQIRNVGLFWITGGSRIRFERLQGVSDDDVKIFLLGSCLGAILQQRGNLVMHASSIVTESGAAMFTGYPGAGKSSLLSAFLSLGYSMLGDDVSVVSLENNHAWVLPGYPQAKLNGDTLEKIGVNSEGLRWINSLKSKFALPATDQFHQQPVNLKMLCLLQPYDGGDIRIDEISTVQKFEIFAQNIYRQAFMRGMGLMPDMFEAITQVASGCRVFRVSRPQETFELLELAKKIESDLF